MASFDRVEVYAHPSLSGCRSFKLQGSSDNVTYTTITAVDTATLESRVAEGGATISFSSSTFTMTGDYAGINFTSTQTYRYLRVLVLDPGTDEWAKVLEIRAHKFVDAAANRDILSFSARHDSEPLLRRPRARSLDLRLENSSGRYSPLRTDVASYNAQMGSGCRVLAWGGYKDSPGEMVRLGTFYVDRWTEDRANATVQITARDGVKLMSTQVNPNYKAGYRHWEIIRYLANLSGIPNQNMVLGRSSSIVDYFAATNVVPYTEAQKICEAMGNADMHFDADGYLVLRATGFSAGNTRLESLAGINSATSAQLPMAQLGNVLYVPITSQNAGVGEVRVAAYTPSTSTWALAGGLIDTHTIGQPERSLCVASDGKIILFDINTGTSSRVWEYTGTAWAKVHEEPTKYWWPGTLQEPLFPVVMNGYLHVFSASRSTMTTWNLQNYDNSATVLGANDSAGGGLGDLTVHGVAVESVAAGEPTGSTALYSPNGIRIAGAYTTTAQGEVYDFDEALGSGRRDIAGLWTGQAVDVRAIGFAGGGDGYVYAMNVGENLAATSASFVRAAPIPSTSSVNLTSVGILSDVRLDEAAASARDGGALVVNDGIAIAGNITYSGSNGERHILLWDVSPNLAIDGGPLTLGGARVQNFQKVTIGSDVYLFGGADNIRVFEMKWRRALPDVTTAVLSLSAENGTAMAGGMVLEAGDEAQGDSKIATQVVVKSSPYRAYASETLWEAKDLPWAIGAQGRLKMKIKLKDPAVPPQTVAITGPAGITASLSSHVQEPVLTILGGGTSGNITALTVSGTPLRKAHTLISIIFGSASSLNRYGIQRRDIENDYVYDTMAQTAIGLGILARFQTRKMSLQDLGLNSALWHLELYDRITLSDTSVNDSGRTGLSGDYYVVGLSWDYLSQQTKLKLVQV